MDKVSSRHVTWIDIENPTDTEIALLLKKYSIHPLVAQEIVVPTYRPKIEEYEDHLYLVLHFPVFDAHTRSTIPREIDFIIFPYNIITIHYEPIPQLDDFKELLAGHEALRERNFGFSAAHLLHALVSRLFHASLKELDLIEVKIKLIEDKIFNDREEEVLKDVASVRRDILSFRKALKPQQTVLASLVEHSKKFFGGEASPYLNDIRNEYIQLWNSVEDLQETLEALYDTNMSLLNANTNNIMKTLATLTSLLLPATLIGTMYGMNFDDMPFTQNPDGLWIVVGIMIFVVFVIYRIFRHRGWL